MVKYDALIAIDMQNALVCAHPYHEAEAVANIRALIGVCRTRGIPVLYVRHNEEGSEFAPGSEGWQIYGAVAPLPDEMIFDKRFNSAFRQTGLREYLEARGIKNLILCGMQTEYCMDVSIKVAFEYGFNVTVPRDTTATFDAPPLSAAGLTAFYDRMWNGRYARVVPVEDVLSEIGA